MLEPLYRNVIAFALVSLILLALLDYSMTRHLRRLASTVLCLAAALLLLRVSVRFPEAHRAFAGGIPLLAAVCVLFLSTAIGIAANYLFYFRGRFSWIAALKPLCVTPIVLLPVLGVLQGLTLLQPVQLVSFGFLGFQNGFFWRTILDQAKTKIS
jgi:hypothetical protein